MIIITRGKSDKRKRKERCLFIYIYLYMIELHAFYCNITLDI